MPLKQPSRILFIRPSALGDVCRSVPVVASLHRAFPDATIDWLVQSEFIDAIIVHPAISNVIPFPRNVLRKWYTPSGMKHIWKLCKQLQNNRYDLVIDGQGLGRSGFLTWVTGAPHRIGPSNAREFGWLGYTDRVNITKTHTVDVMLELLERLNIEVVKDMKLYVDPPSEVWWSTYCKEHEVDRYAVLAPTSRWKSKQWPIDRFVEVAIHLQQQGLKIVVIGAPTEIDQIELLEQTQGVINLLPTMTIARLLAVIEHAELVIGNDSAALHMAVGLNRPLIALFGPTNPAEVGPYQQLESVIASSVQYDQVHYRDMNRGDRIMQEISTSSVISKIDEMIAGQQ